MRLGRWRGGLGREGEGGKEDRVGRTKAEREECEGLGWVGLRR